MLNDLQQIIQFYLNPENADRVASIISVAGIVFLVAFVPAQLLLVRRLGGVGAFFVAAIGGATAFVAVLFWYAPADFLREFRTADGASWSLQLNTPGYEEVTATRALSSGDVVIGVNVVSPAADSVKAMLRTYSPTGTLRWANKVGAGGNARIVSIAVNDLDQIFVAGEAIEFVPDESGFLQLGRATPFLTRVSSSGTIEWERTINPTVRTETADPGNMHLSVSKSILLAFGTQLKNEPNATEIMCLSDTGQLAWVHRLVNDKAEFLGVFAMDCEDGSSIAEVIGVAKPVEPADSTAKVEKVIVSGTRIPRPSAPPAGGAKITSVPQLNLTTVPLPRVFSLPRYPSPVLVGRRSHEMSAFKSVIRISEFDALGNVARQKNHELETEPYVDLEVGTPIRENYDDYIVPVLQKRGRERTTLSLFKLSDAPRTLNYLLELPTENIPGLVSIAAVSWQKDDGVAGPRLVLAGSYRLLPRGQANVSNNRIVFASMFPLGLAAIGCGGCVGPDGKLANWLSVFAVPENRPPTLLFSKVYDNAGDSRFADVDVSRNGDLIAAGIMGGNEGCCGDAPWRSDGFLVREDRVWATRVRPAPTQSP